MIDVLMWLFFFIIVFGTFVAIGLLAMMINRCFDCVRGFLNDCK